jgi:hypothetical protein
MNNMLDGSGMSTQNFDATLNGWYEQSLNGGGVQEGVTLGADGLTYSDASLEAREALANDHGWIFEGASEAQGDGDDASEDDTITDDESDTPEDNDGAPEVDRVPIVERDIPEEESDDSDDGFDLADALMWAALMPLVGTLILFL